MKTITTSCFVILLSVSLSQLQAQITIGSTEPPVIGALLDLKNEAAGKSTKGLLLPRVMLENENELKPMFTYKDGDEPSDEDKILHTGLIVYNLKKTQKDPCDFTVGRLQEGLFAWTGSEWIDVSNPNDGDINKDKLELSVRNPEVKIFYDKRDSDNPQPYACRHFKGEKSTDIDAGVWMTTNLRATTYDNSVTSWPLNKGGQSSSSPRGQFYMAPYPYYKGTTANAGFDTYWLEQNPIAGYAYNYGAIIMGGTKKVQGKNNTLVDRKQGLCPKGWHVPLLEDFQELKKAIYQHPEKYLYEDDNGGYNFTQNYTNAFIVPCTPYETIGSGSSQDWSKTLIGHSKSYSDGGYGDFGLGILMNASTPKALTKNSQSIVYDNQIAKDELDTDINKRPQYLLLEKEGKETEKNQFPYDNLSLMMSLRCKKDVADFNFD